ncbi:MAG TPA: hypothetical protein VGN70_03755 [Gammaproteobacteria bacterium]|jgi:hypothetical protein
MMDLHGLTMYVSATADIGVVGADTLLHFTQKHDRVLARYSGGSIARGYLVGEMSENSLSFRYTQVEASGEIHGGSSICDLVTLPDGRTRIVEHFTWRTREGSGDNVFDELRGSENSP